MRITVRGSKSISLVLAISSGTCAYIEYWYERHYICTYRGFIVRTLRILFGIWPIAWLPRWLAWIWSLLPVQVVRKKRRWIDDKVEAMFMILDLSYNLLFLGTREDNAQDPRFKWTAPGSSQNKHREPNVVIIASSLNALCTALARRRTAQAWLEFFGLLPLFSAGGYLSVLAMRISMLSMSSMRTYAI